MAYALLMRPVSSQRASTALSGSSIASMVSHSLKQSMNHCSSCASVRVIFPSVDR